MVHTRTSNRRNESFKLQTKNCTWRRKVNKALERQTDTHMLQVVIPSGEILIIKIKYTGPENSLSQTK